MKHAVAESTTELHLIDNSRFTSRSESGQPNGGSVRRGAELSAHVSIAKSRIELYSHREKIVAATKHAAMLEQIGGLTELNISVLAKEGRYEELIASIARVSHLRYCLVDSMMSGHRLRELAFVCKSLGFKLATLHEIFRLARSLNRATEAEVRDARREFIAVSNEIAKSVLAAMSSLNSRPSSDRISGCQSRVGVQ